VPIFSGFALTLALTSVSALTIKTTTLSEAFGLIAISPASTGLASRILPALNLKTTVPSKAFGLTIISPAWAAPTVKSNEATMPVSDYIFGPFIGFSGRTVADLLAAFTSTKQTDRRT
jgi:hypothetical protein